MNFDDLNPHHKGPELSAEDLAALGGPKMVYIRQVEVADVVSELREEHGPDAEIEIPEDAELYAVHAADGERLALRNGREAAFVAARQNEMEPVSVH